MSGNGEETHKEAWNTGASEAGAYIPYGMSKEKLRDKLRALAEEWLQQAYALDVLSSPAERIETHARVRLLEYCARELSALIER